MKEFFNVETTVTTNTSVEEIRTRLTVGSKKMAAHSQTLQSDRRRKRHFSHPSPTFFSCRHPGNTPGKHCTHARARAVSMTLRTTTPFVLTDKLRLWLIWRDRHYFQNLCGTSTVTWGTPPHNQSQKEVSPVAPIDASLLFAVDGPMVVGEVLHGDGVLAQRLLILAVLAPDLVEVAHCGGKERDGIRKKKRSAARDSGCKIRARFQSRKPSKGNLGGVTELKKIGGRHLFGRKRTKATGGHFQRTIPTWWL